jgi:hypothetical protein
VHVVYLKNAEAVKLAQTLRSIISGDTSALPVPVCRIQAALRMERIAR